MAVLSLTPAPPAAAQLLLLEPDAYPAGTVLDRLLPQLTLTSAGANNRPIAPVPFPITVAGTPPGYASTGTNVFAHAGVNFFNHDRRLRLDFAGLVEYLALDAIGSGFNLSPERGHLEAYNTDNVLVAAFVTEPLNRAQVQTMTIQRPGPDIAWAVAWSEDGTFARFDHLVFSVPVPEPGAFSLLAVGLGLLAGAGAGSRGRGRGRIWPGTCGCAGAPARPLQAR